MSLAQRRTAAEGIDTALEYDAPENGTYQSFRDSTTDDERRRGRSPYDMGSQIIKNDELWHDISHDPFAPKPFQHFDSFPPEITDNRAAYEVSAAKRAGKSHVQGMRPAEAPASPISQTTG